jgi:Pentapeptide repeats (8 copies)
MSDQQSESAAPACPKSDDREAWKDYWQEQGMPWRTEPEIDEARQGYLAQRRAMVADTERGVYPFTEITLTRADVEWLLATHESGGRQGPIDWSDSTQRTRDGLDLRGADLRRADLHALPVARLRGAHLFEEQWTTNAWQDAAAAVRLEESDLRDAHLEGALLDKARLQRAELAGASMQHAQLAGAQLQEAHLRETHLEGANLTGAHLEGAMLRWTHLGGAELAGAQCDSQTAWWRPRLRSAAEGTATLRDVVWGGANLSYVDWAHVAPLGDERLARQSLVPPELEAFGMTPLTLMEAAARANQQLALALRAQGISEWADQFAYRAQVLQREVLRGQGKLLRFAGVLLLDLISGYGYRPLRSVITYLLVILGFAVGYYLLGNHVHPPLSPLDAVIFSITSFHGRGFTPGELITLHNPLTILAAGEAVIEITFIATFTQRFFAR